MNVLDKFEILPQELIVKVSEFHHSYCDKCNKYIVFNYNKWMCLTCIEETKKQNVKRHIYFSKQLMSLVDKFLFTNYKLNNKIITDFSLVVILYDLHSFKTKWDTGLSGIKFSKIF